MASLDSSSSLTSFDSSAEHNDVVAMIIHNRLVRIGKVIKSSEQINHRRYLRREREGHRRMWKDYFAENPVYTDSIFLRRFCMRRHLFNRVLDAVVGYSQYFLQQQDACKQLGLTPHQKIIVALRCLAYRGAADAVDEYIRISETMILKTLLRFCFAIVTLFCTQYMRKPTAIDVERLLKENSTPSFPGMLGSVDYMHWKWKNFSAAWHGQYTGHIREPTIILEAVASYDLWFWHSFFEIPGCNNDLNMLNRSTLFNEILDGCAPSANFVINNHNYNMDYCLADGIYPPLAPIVKTYTTPDTQKKKKFTEMQEGAEKDVERAFGVLQSRFAIVKGPTCLWDADSLSYIRKTCIILHNMIVEDEREEEILDCEYDQIPNSTMIEPSRGGPTDQEGRILRNVILHDRQKYHALRQDLVEHIWSQYGDE